MLLINSLANGPHERLPCDRPGMHQVYGKWGFFVCERNIEYRTGHSVRRKPGRDLFVPRQPGEKSRTR